MPEMRLNKIFVSIWALLLFGMICPAASLARFDQPVFKPLEFHPPKGKVTVLPNGMKVYLLEDHELPLIRINAVIKVGSLYEPEEMIGLASFTGALMRTGGAGGKSGDEIDEILEFLSAGISTGIGVDSGGASLDVLAKDFDQGLMLFSDILMRPGFSEEKLDLLKKQEIEGIRRKNDHPPAIVSREFGKLIYGADSPYARESTIESVNKITRKDIQEYHAKFFHPNAIIFGVTGDFKSGEMIAKLTKAFGSWEKKEVEYPPVKPVVTVFTPSVNLVEKDVSQAYIRLGHLGVKQDNPDYFALSVMDDILGGQAFTSRLFKEVRTRQGLAYGVGSAVIPGNSAPGLFFAYCQTMSGKTGKALSAILENIRKIREEPVSQEELKQAKDSFLNSFIFSFSNPSQIVSRQISLDYWGLPADFLEKFRENVSRVTADDVLRVAKKYIHPEGLTILVVGKSAEFDRPLSDFGPVRVIPLEKTP